MTKHRNTEENNARHTAAKKSSTEAEREGGSSFLKDGEQLIVIPIRRHFATIEAWNDNSAEIHNSNADGGAL